jgi:hypothetical protein
MIFGGIGQLCRSALGSSIGKLAGVWASRSLACPVQRRLMAGYRLSGTKAPGLSILGDALGLDLRRIFSIEDHRLRRSRLPRRAVVILSALLSPRRCIAEPVVLDSFAQDRLRNGAPDPCKG